MFYSQLYLGRKGPLGTVWQAAHLQHRLKKSHYVATNIPKSVDLIMFSEAPMALRLSSHLLLGVVRIYSKQVEYLFRDCNLFSIWLAKAFVTTQVDLPEDARQAPVDSVTLPQALNLDDFNLEYDTLEGKSDNHLRNVEDITLTDQIPTGIDPYVSVTFDEDMFPEISQMDIDEPTAPVSGHPRDTDVEMDYEAGPSNEHAEFDTGVSGLRIDTEEIHGFSDPRPSNLTEPINQSPQRSNANSYESVPEIEIRRDAAHDLSPVSHPSFATEQHNATVECTEPLDETLNEKEPTIDEVMLDSERHSVFELRSGSPGFAGSVQEPGNFVHPSPHLVLRSTPPHPPQARLRKRKNFEKVTVLSNRIMRERLEDHSDIRCKRRKMPSSRVNIWRLNNQSKKDQNFNEPLLTGFSDVLGSVFEKDCVSSKPYLAVSDETIAEPGSEVNPTSSIPQSPVPDTNNPDSTVQLSPRQQTEDVQDSAGPQSAHVESVAREAQSPLPFNNDDMGIEQLRDGGLPHEFMPSPPPRSSPFRTDDFTAQLGSSETGSYRTEPLTSTYPENLSEQRNSGLSDIPEMVDKELYFLEVSGNTPIRSPASQESDALTGRTRALAQYLKERSSSSPASRYSYGDLSLNKILTGKSRKLAARMFFETLVLKSRGLVDVQQDQPYSDIALKLLPGLFPKDQT
ncbi:unnamed protein product [Cochlearia groenlandica]